MPWVLEIVGNPWAKARRELGLPPVKTPVLPVNLLAWALGKKQETCQPLVQPQLNSWLIEYSQPLKPYQASSCKTKHANVSEG